MSKKEKITQERILYRTQFDPDKDDTHVWFYSGDSREGHRPFPLLYATWKRMGKPSSITVIIEPGNTVGDVR